MHRGYGEWHALKSKIDRNGKPILFRARDVWWCSLGANVGVEMDGKHSRFERPVLVFRKFNSDMFWGIPLTSREKTDDPFFFHFILHEKEEVAVISQMRILSSKRLIRRMGKISDAQFKRLVQEIVTLITKADPSRGPRVPNGNNQLLNTSNTISKVNADTTAAAVDTC